MERLIIDNIGPVQHADVEIKKLAVFIGPQSSGKSTIAKVFSFCCWLDKMTDLTHKALATGAYKRLESYHRMKGYLKENSRIRYVGENIVYEYNYGQDDTLTPNVPYNIFPCGDAKERCYEKVNRSRSPKVEYIPAERNFVSSVPDLRNYLEADDCLQDFVNTWYKVKRMYTKEQPMDVLGLDMQYYYDDAKMCDYVWLKTEEKPILLSSASSGIQSLVPLLGLVWQFTSGIYHNQAERPFSPAENEQIMELLQARKDGLYGGDVKEMVERVLGFAKGKIYTHTQLILEEPEQNLFPDTQCRLINHLLRAINHGKDHRLLMTTHSPYVLNYLNVLLRRSKDCEVSFDGKEMSVYRIHEGVTSNLLGQDTHGSFVVDAIDLNETMVDIYKEFVALQMK